MSALSDFYEDELVDGIFRDKSGAKMEVWQASTAYTAGDWVIESTPVAGDPIRVYECTTGGTSAGTEPTWTTTLGDDTTDNTVTWRTAECGALKRSIWIALFTTSASLANLEAGTLTGEVSGGSYARVEPGVTDSIWNAPGASAGGFLIDNTASIDFTTATASWGTVRYAAIMDAATSGNVLLYGQLAADKVVDNGDTFKFNAGDLDITFGS